MRDSLAARGSVLMVGQLPPPFHGQAIMNALVLDAEFDALEKVVLPMAYSETADQVGKAGFAKVLHLCSLILRTWWLWFRHRPSVLYYPPASANRIPIWRDILYLGCTRFLFPKMVFHFHAGGLVDFMQHGGWLGSLARWVYRRPDLSVELYQEPDSPGKFLGAKRVEVIANAVEVGLPVATLSEGPFRILFVGALSEEKGVLEVIEVVLSLRQRGIEVVAELAGAWVSADFRETALRRVRENELEQQICWLGSVQGERKWEVFRRAHCFFFPTRYSAEKFPLVLLEALGMGLPIVSTQWRGIPQLVEGSGAASLCPVGDQPGFVEAIAKLVLQPEYRQKTGQRARDHYQKHYTVEKFLQSIEQSLLEVVQKG